MHLHFDYNLSESKNRCEYVLFRSRNVNIILNREAKPIDILPLHERRTVRHRAIHSRQDKPNFVEKNRLIYIRLIRKKSDVLFLTKISKKYIKILLANGKITCYN